MEVAQQCDAESIQSRWPTPQPNFLFDQSWKVGIQQNSVRRERTRSNRCAQPDKFPSVNKRKRQSFSNLVPPE